MNLTVISLRSEQAVLRLVGRLDTNSADTLKAAVQDQMAAGVTYVTLDMGGVSLMDSSGLWAVFYCQKLLREVGGALNLAAIGPQVRTVLQITMLEGVLPVFDTVDEAVARFTP